MMPANMTEKADWGTDMTTTTNRRGRRWTLARRITDRLFPRVFPGNHHPVWSAS
jgi:hypothetical protein